MYDDTDDVKDFREEVAEEASRLKDNPFQESVFWPFQCEQYDLPRYNIYDHLRAGSVLLIIAPPKHGKSFTALEIAWSVSSGRPFLGQHPVDVKGPVLYVAGEGEEETGGRVVARHRASGEPYPRTLAIYPHPHDLRDVGANQRLLDWAGGQGFKVVIFDTVSRCGGGKEDAEDLTKLVAGVSMLNQKMGATIVLLHHTPKDNPGDSRGHTSLPAAVDCQWLMAKRDGAYTITASFARSAEDEDDKPFAAFRVENVVLGTNEDGREVGYGVAAPCDIPEKEHRPREPKETREDKARRMHEEEKMTLKDIARRFKVTEGAVRYWLRK